MKLAWNGNREPDVVGYQVCYGTAPRAYVGFVDVGNKTSVSLADLSPDDDRGVTYYFAVKAYSGFGASRLFSEPSKEVSWLAPA